MLTVGVLALQGAFSEHIHQLKACQTHVVIEVRTADQLALCDALVIPGGESTAISLIAQRTNLLPALYAFVADESKLVWGTCAGLIFMAQQCSNGKPDQKLLGGMSIRVERNAFGRQLESFETPLDFSSFIPNVTDFPTIFIRAPIVESVELEKAGPGVVCSENSYENKEKVEVLSVLENGHVVAVRQGKKLGTSFHPELTDDIRFHKWFLEEFVTGTD